MGATRNPAFSGARLRAARERKKLSRGVLAVRVGMSFAAVSAWERGVHAPPPPSLVKVAQVLGVEPADLLDTPRDEWTLAEYRIVEGLHQQDVATALAVAPDKLSRVEAGYEAPGDLLPRLAELYGTTATVLQVAWDRTRAGLLEDGD